MHAGNRTYIRARWRRFGFLCLWFYSFILVYVTLFTHNYYVYGRSFNFDLFDSILLMWHSGNIELMLKNIVGNVLLFVPEGFFLTLLVKGCRHFLIMFAVGSGSSLLIEIAQYEYAKRIFDIDDILLNVIGAFLGWLTAWIVLRAFKKAGG